LRDSRMRYCGCTLSRHRLRCLLACADGMDDCPNPCGDNPCQYNSCVAFAARWHLIQHHPMPIPNTYNHGDCDCPVYYYGKHRESLGFDAVAVGQAGVVAPVLHQSSVRVKDYSGQSSVHAASRTGVVNLNMVDRNSGIDRPAILLNPIKEAETGTARKPHMLPRAAGLLVVGCSQDHPAGLLYRPHAQNLVVVGNRDSRVQNGAVVAVQHFNDLPEEDPLAHVWVGAAVVNYQLSLMFGQAAVNQCLNVWSAGDVSAYHERTHSVVDLLRRIG
jgi:hypothetical protein